MDLQIKSLNDLDVVAKMFIKSMSNRTVFAFYGEMGSGKTTFIKAICKAMGVTETITSPTFSLVNEYKSDKGMSIFHFDFYRIKNIEEAFDFGYEDYFYSGNVCFIEWPELIESLLPEDVVNVKIKVDDNEHRLITID